MMDDREERIRRGERELEGPTQDHVLEVVRRKFRVMTQRAMSGQQIADFGEQLRQEFKCEVEVEYRASMEAENALYLTVHLPKDPFTVKLTL